jgi:hypothetical protein
MSGYGCGDVRECREKSEEVYKGKLCRYSADILSLINIAQEQLG